jgi:hypothetical protein
MHGTWPDRSNIARPGLAYLEAGRGAHCRSFWRLMFSPALDEACITVGSPEILHSEGG